MDNLFYILESIGIISFAISGMIMAEQKKFDPVGWYIIACVTAFGGGTVRDLILDVQPVYWISHWEYPVIILGMTVLFYVVSRIKIPRSWLIVTDALGLSLFSITAAQVAAQNQHPWIIVLILSVMTATFGGVIRDTLCNEVPMIFQKVSFYGTVSGSAVLLYLSLNLYFPESIAMGSAIVFGFVFRLLAYRFNWRFR